MRGFPEIAHAELIKYFTLTSPDEGFVRKFAGQRNVLGASVQLCTLPWWGSCPTSHRSGGGGSSSGGPARHPGR
ncbi:MAG TPA: DUF4158 domain-containing protein [Pseudonocardiaceae bacterium]